jgi:hypothetical protein
MYEDDSRLWYIAVYLVLKKYTDVSEVITASIIRAIIALSLSP